MTLFETSRLLVRRFEQNDLAPLHVIVSDPAVMRFLEPPFSREQTANFLREAGLSSPPLVYAIKEKGSSLLLGHLIYHPFDEESYELGWVLTASAWNQGFASELTEAAIAFAKNAKLASLVIECAPMQSVTRHIAEKYGFSLVSEEETLLYRLCLKDK